jgi:hypothetical protein
VLPRAGAIMSILRGPIMMGSLAAAIAVAMVVYRQGGQEEPERRDRAEERTASTPAYALARSRRASRPSARGSPRPRRP